MIGAFEPDRSVAETAPEEQVHDFDFLLEELRAAPRDSVQQRMPEWIERFRLGWTNGSDQWATLTDLLPRPLDAKTSVANFRQLLLSATREATASDAFLTHPAIAPKLSSYAWTDYLGGSAAGFVAGCLNLARAAAQSGSPSATVMGALSEAVANHLPTLIAIGLHDPGIIAPTPDGCVLADSLDIPRERFERWSFEKSEADLLQLLANFEIDRILDVLRSILGQTPLTTALLTPIVKMALGSDDARAAASVNAFAFEDRGLSGALKERCLREMGPARAETLATWARYVALDDAFAFGWECVRPAGSDGAPPTLGEPLAARLKTLDALLKIPRAPADLEIEPGADWSWRDPAAKALAAIGGLTARKWTQREDQMVCEDDAIAALGKSPALLANVVRGVLDECQSFWDVIDPVILRLPRELISPVLSGYVDQATLGSDSRHHAARLLATINGETAAAPSGEALPQAAEVLAEASRERKPLLSQTWLANGPIERFWHVALEVAQTRFDECMVNRYDDEKEDHCAALGDIIVRALNGSNAAMKMWMKSNGAPAPSIKAAVRRAAPKGKRANAGLQADIGFLIRCNVAGRCVTKRITPMRAKKLGKVAHGWSNDFKIAGAERTQLTRLLTISTATHYLFLLPRELGDSLRVLPGPLVRDMAAAQGFAGGVPVQTVLQAGLRLPEFMLFNILGLWTGDDDADLIAKAESEDTDQQPHVTVEINISRE